MSTEIFRKCLKAQKCEECQKSITQNYFLGNHFENTQKSIAQKIIENTHRAEHGGESEECGHSHTNLKQDQENLMCTWNGT